MLPGLNLARLQKMDCETLKIPVRDLLRHKYRDVAQLIVSVSLVSLNLRNSREKVPKFVVQVPVRFVGKAALPFLFSKLLYPSNTSSQFVLVGPS